MGQCALIIVLAALAAACLPAPEAQASAGARMDRSERAIVHAINIVRRQHGLGRVYRNRGLNRAADAHSRDMLRANFFAHASSNGTSMGDRVRRYKRARRIGETLAYLPRGNRSGGAWQVVNMWMNSPGHRATILTRGFRRIGVAKQRGAIGGNRVTVFTVDFSSSR